MLEGPRTEKKGLLLLQEKRQIQIQRLWLRSHLLIEPIHTVASTTKCLALFFLGFSLL